MNLRSGRTAIFTWCIAFALAAIAISLVKFISQDPDSATYAFFSERMAGLPFRTWIAPGWWGVGGRTGPFQEHPVGAFLLPAVIGKLGVPPAQAGPVVGVALSIAVLLLLKSVAAFVVEERESAVVPWVALLMPVAFINRIRSTQEYPMLVCLLVAVYAIQKSRRSPAWMVVAIGAACGMVLVKGIFVVFFPIIGALWILCIREGERGDGWAWLAIGLSVVSVVLCTLGYEHLYRQATGQSFLGYYLPYRLGQLGAAQQPGAMARLVERLDNVSWYSIRLLWFALPGTLALILAVPTWARADRGVAGRRRVQGLSFAIGTAAAYVAVMSLGGTRADRFILPAYFALGIAGALVAIRRWSGPARLADRLAGLPPYALALAWLVLTLLALPFEIYVPYVRFRW